MFFRSVIVMIFLTVGASEAVAQSAAFPGFPGAPSQEAPKEKAIAVDAIDGRLVGAFDLITVKGTQSVSLFIDLGSSHSLSLDEEFKVAAGISNPRGIITLKSLQGFSGIVRGAVVSTYEGTVSLKSLSSLYSTELGGRPLVGSVGVGLLDSYHLSVDILKGQISLEPPKAPRRELNKADGDFVIPMLDGPSISLAVQVGDEPATMSLSTTHFDTYVDAVLARQLGHPGGDIPAVGLPGVRVDNAVDLSSRLVFRPEPVEAISQGMAFEAGLNFLKDFRTDIDFVNRVVVFTALQVPTYPATDAEFFRAMSSEDEDLLVHALTTYPDERLAADAAALLFDLRLKRNADDKAILEAAQFVRDTALKRNRGGVCLDLMAAVNRTYPDRLSLFTAIAQLGVEVARHDQDPLNLFLLHKSMGLEFLAKGQIAPAWKSLLSAAFGLTDDPMVSYGLGRVYEAQNRLRRAQSRYQRALEIVSQTEQVDEADKKRFTDGLARVDALIAAEDNGASTKEPTDD